MRLDGSRLILPTPVRYERVLRRWRRCPDPCGAWINNYMGDNVVREVRRHLMIAELSNGQHITVRCLRKSRGRNRADHLPMNVVDELIGRANSSTTAEFYSTVTADREAKAQWIVEALTMGKEE